MPARARRPRPLRPRSSAARIAAAVALILAASLAAGCARRLEGLREPGPEATVLRGDHFRVILHFPCPSGAPEALAAAEAAWPHVVDLFGVPDRPLEDPLDIHVYRRVDEYEDVEKSLTNGKFRLNLGFSHHRTRTAHVALQPQLSDRALGALGLPPQTLRLLGHEAVHIATFSSLRNSAWFPDWLDEGAATRVEQSVMATLGLSPRDAEEDPWTGTYFWRAGRLLAKERLPSVADILRDRLSDLTRVDRYAVQAVFFSFLLTGDYRDRLDGIIGVAKALPGGESFEREFLRRVEEILRSGGRPVERDFRQYVASLRPRWIERRRSLERGGEDWLQIAFPSSDAVAWTTEPVGRDAYRVSGSLEFLPNPGNGLYLLLGQSPSGVLRIVFEAGYGVRVFQDTGGEGRVRSRRIASARCPSLAGGTEVPFEISVRGRRVRVGIGTGTDEVIEFTVRDLDLSGPWGLGARPGAAGVWRSIRVDNA